VTRSSGRPGACLAGLALAALALAASAILAAAPAGAAARPVSQCSARSGVIIAVDFAHWAGPLLRACDSTPSTGYALLNQGGWHTAGTEHDGPGFVCRIGYAGYRHGTQYPTLAQQACVVTPPANAYWSFWQAGPGQDTWNYSQVGLMSYRPVPGSVELWSFGATNVSGTAGSAMPTISPDRLRDLAGSSAGASAGTPIINAPPVLRASAAGPGGSVRPTLIAAAIAVLLAAAAIAASRRRARPRR
jgi:hypothetical protein